MKCLAATAGLLLLVACGSANDLRWAWTGKQVAGVEDVSEIDSDVLVDPGVKDDGVKNPGIQDQGPADVLSDFGKLDEGTAIEDPGDLLDGTYTEDLIPDTDFDSLGSEKVDPGPHLDIGLDVCVPACAGKECGDDGCGGSCGTCTGDKTCVEGKCKMTTPTWTDPSTGLVWQNPPYDGTKYWEAAKSYCTNLSLDGGGWHLPNISELRSLIRGCPNTETGGACGVTDVCPECGVNQKCLSWNWCKDDCSKCSDGSGPADGCYWPDEMEGTCYWYWSSSPLGDNEVPAWDVGFHTGRVSGHFYVYDGGSLVRCVR